MLHICPGYKPSVVCVSVARARRFAPPPGGRPQNLPGGDAAHLSGRQAFSRLRFRSPGKALCAAPGERPQNLPGGDAAHLSGLQAFIRLRFRSPGKALCAAPGRKTAESSRRRYPTRVIPASRRPVRPGGSSDSRCSGTGSPPAPGESPGRLAVGCAAWRAWLWSP